MRKLICIGFIVLFPLLFSACLNSGGTNVTKDKVLSHYSGRDTVMFKAADYLLKSLENRYYYDGDLLKEYLKYGKYVLIDQSQGARILSLIESKHGGFRLDQLQLKYDLEHSEPDSIIAHINSAYHIWRTEPWSSKYSFDQFCEYILPYRIADEIPTFDTESIYNRYKHLFLGKNKDTINAIAACKIINDELIKERWLLSSRTSFLPHYPMKNLLGYRIGSCRDMSDLALHVMRRFGIPVAQDFLIQWPYRSIGHTWNVVIKEDGGQIMFLGAEDSPGTPHRPFTKKGKVYRRTALSNKAGLAELKLKRETIPEVFNNRYLRDVSAEYFSSFSPKIEFSRLPYDSSRFAYLNVFNNKTWIPVGWGKINGKSATFKNFEPEIIYLPSFFSRLGNLPSAPPFLLSSSGAVVFLIPDYAKRIKKMTITKVYPVTPEMYAVDDATGGELQGADAIDFQNPATLYKFENRALPGWNKIKVNTGKKFRFLRFLAAKDKRYGVAELHVFFGTKKLKLSAFTESGEANKEVNQAIDGDTSTSYTSKKNGGAFVIDLGAAKMFSEIKLMTKINESETMKIVTGDAYELRCWTDHQFKTIDKKVATQSSLTFEQLPSNGLFILHNVDRAVEERIFTIKNGVPNWY